tara:strand:- start:152 stop:370 length:219 start_codon:yes stop_codon:yes gene_type:complete
MATELKSIKGKFQSNRSEIGNTQMSLTRFNGGKEGIKLQLTIRNQGEFFTHIAINKKQIKKFIKELQQNFDL